MDGSTQRAHVTARLAGSDVGDRHGTEDIEAQSARGPRRRNDTTLAAPSHVTGAFRVRKVPPSTLYPRPLRQSGKGPPPPCLMQKGKAATGRPVPPIRRRVGPSPAQRSSTAVLLSTTHRARMAATVSFHPGQASVAHWPHLRRFKDSAPWLKTLVSTGRLPQKTHRTV